MCLQVNIDGGETKSGVAPDEVLALAREVAQMPRLVLRGLMTIPDPVDGFDAQVAVHAKAQAMFALLKNELQKDLQGELKLPQFDTLSMGMTADLEARDSCRQHDGAGGYGYFWWSTKSCLNPIDRVPLKTRQIRMFDLPRAHQHLAVFSAAV